MLEKTAGVDILGTPRVTTLSGDQAQLQLGDVKMLAGIKHQLGPIVDLVPTILPDKVSIALQVVVSCEEILGFEDAAEIMPLLRKWRAQSSSVLRDGETLVIRARDDNGGEGPGAVAEPIG